MEFRISDRHLELYIQSTCVNERRYTLQEESSELIKELSKVNRYKSDRSKIIEEMTHVLISLYSVARDMDITQEDITAQVNLKSFKEE